MKNQNSHETSLQACIEACEEAVHASQACAPAAPPPTITQSSSTVFGLSFLSVISHPLERASVGAHG